MTSPGRGAPAVGRVDARRPDFETLQPAMCRASCLNAVYEACRRPTRTRWFRPALGYRWHSRGRGTHLSGALLVLYNAQLDASVLGGVCYQRRPQRPRTESTHHPLNSGAIPDKPLS